MTTDDGLNLDTISLEQALMDVEIANGRVMDLTRRLHSLGQELTAIRRTFLESDVGRLDLENQSLRAEVLALRLKLARRTAQTK